MSEAAVIDIHRAVCSMSMNELRAALDGAGVVQALRGVSDDVLMDPVGLANLMVAVGESVAAYYVLRGADTSKDRRRRITDAYLSSTESVADLAYKLGVSRMTIYRVLKQNGVALRVRKNGAGGAQ